MLKIILALAVAAGAYAYEIADEAITAAQTRAHTQIQTGE
jgi:hypothetical protein